MNDLEEMAYGLLNGHVTDDVAWPPKVLWGSTVGYPSDSLASCLLRTFFTAPSETNAYYACLSVCLSVSLSVCVYLFICPAVAVACARSFY